MITDASSFEVQRSNWSYGAGKETKLINDNGYKDCLGFFLLASGFSLQQLKEAFEPIDLIKYDWTSKLLTWEGQAVCQSQICNEIIAVNDNEGLSQKERENKLVALFKAIDVDLQFVE